MKTLAALTVLAAAALLPSCAGWSYKGSVGYDQWTVSAEFIAPSAAQGKQPVKVLK